MKKERYRIGSIALRKYILVIGVSKKELAKRFDKHGIDNTFNQEGVIVKQKGDTWDLIKFEKDSEGKESCYTIATIQWKNNRTEYDIVSCGMRLLDLSPKDLIDLRKVIVKYVEPCVK